MSGLLRSRLLTKAVTFDPLKLLLHYVQRERDGGRESKDVRLVNRPRCAALPGPEDVLWAAAASRCHERLVELWRPLKTHR